MQDKKIPFQFCCIEFELLKDIGDGVHWVPLAAGRGSVAGQERFDMTRLAARTDWSVWASRHLSSSVEVTLLVAALSAAAYSSI